jgi:hypothetical protein
METFVIASISRVALVHERFEQARRRANDHDDSNHRTYALFADLVLDCLDSNLLASELHGACGTAMLGLLDF